ncbi:MAG: MATE family efflux transporter [Lachnospiraceae bacterium]|jgi:putative MATE family efflux protein|nr:MATE family efflux transporter [Lachnospiraceae bacterium]MEE3461348.1 MATE family efflux transporter [Lachnospiraceae bacterium]
MKQIDFEHGGTFKNIMASAVPTFAAQFLNLLYNIVDRIYIARIPKVGTLCLGAVGLCFPITILVLAFTNLYCTGGAPLFAMARGRKDNKEADSLQSLTLALIVITAFIIIILGEIFAKPVLIAFGASGSSLPYAVVYLRIYLLGTVFIMTASGMNPFITAQGYAFISMMSVMTGALANIILDPIFIFAFNMGVSGAAIASVISQGLSFLFVIRFLIKHAAYKIHRVSFQVLKRSGKMAGRICGLGTAGMIMQITNALVSISSNFVLSDISGDLYVSIFTIVNSARQMLETPILAIAEGASPVISYNYGARKGPKTRKAIWIMFAAAFSYAIVMWGLMRIFPHFFIGIFSSDKTIMADAIPAFNIYFVAFIFMVFQYTGQTTFKSIGWKGHAIFFSLLRKGFIVIPLTFILPYALHWGNAGVFAAEPVSNVIGGLACFITMVLSVMPELKSNGYKRR